MVDEKEVAEIPKEIIRVENGNYGYTAPIILILIIIPTLLVSCSFLYFYASYQPEPNNNNNINAPLETTTPELSPLKELSSPIIKIIQPQSTIQEYFKELLKLISMELYVKKLLCTPEDFHDLEKHIMPKLASSTKVPEPKGHFVIYIAVGLLLTSLAAALVDVYKVKGKPSKTKPQLTKRCSLADLTVLRHSRRESMRKDSMVDEQRTPLKLLGRKVSRPPLRFNN